MGIGLLALAMSGAIAPSAGAAVTIGETFAPVSACAAGSPFSSYTSASPPTGPSHAAPTDGVITSWSFQSGAVVPTLMRLKVARGTTASLTTVGRGPFELIAASAVNTFPVQIPVKAGDVIGFSNTASPAYQCARPMAGYTFSFTAGDPAPGSTDAYATSGFEIPLAAQLEPDADNDGFGDETQDLCPSDADMVKACRDKAPPETTILKKPKKKDKKKKAKFEFNSSEAGATFRCSLNGSTFDVCSSPRSVKAKKGLNTFTVFARDAAGNADESPATYSWTRKKPKK